MKITDDLIKRKRKEFIEEIMIALKGQSPENISVLERLRQAAQQMKQGVGK